MNAVINLPRRSDRLLRFQQSYAASGWADVLGPVDVSEAVSAEDCPAAWRPHRRGTYGCWQSHLMLIERALSAHEEMLFVFEDDAVFEPDSGAKLSRFLREVPSQDALWFGGELLGNTTSGLGWRRVGAVARTHAYALSSRMMVRVLPELRHMVGHLDVLYLGLIKEFYVPESMLVGQAAGFSDISGYFESERWWRR